MRLDARLYLLFTPLRCAGDPRRTLRAALSGGVELVQWRAPVRDRDDQELLTQVLEIGRSAGVAVIVNDDPQLAVEVGAAGAHVGQGDLPAAEARAILGPDRALGVSTHDLLQIRAAEAGGADHLGFGPCFPTATKGYTEGLPRSAIAAAAAATGLPLFAIGGIHRDNLPSLLELGVRRIAVSAAVLGAPDPQGAARELRALLDR